MRVLFSPAINFETDSFSVLLSAKNIAETGKYLIPPFRLTDGSGYQAFPGWAVGCPLILAVFFKLFGYSEALARFLTILISSAIIPVMALVGRRLYGPKLGVIVAILLAVNPFLVCFNSRILTTNFGFSFFVISVSLLLLAVVRAEKAEIISAQEIISSRNRFILFLLAFLFFGFTLGSRDDYAMFALVFMVIFAAVFKASYKKSENKKTINSLRLFLFASALTLVGYLPNILYNFINYGKFITSSHYEYGGRLSLEYFLNGANTALRLSGGVVMLLAVFVYAFPIISVFFLNLKNKTNLLLVAIISLIVLPVIFIGGAYFTASTGGAPRYIMPAIPFVLLSSGIVLVSGKAMLGPIKKIFLICLIFWNVILFYPPEALFKINPKFVYLTQYSPWYNRNNFMNYPHPITAMLSWVKNNTAAEAVILSDYDSYHYFFYAQRDIADRNNIVEIKKLLASRPVFFVEDHQTLKAPEPFVYWVRELSKHSISLVDRYSLPLFSPFKGKTHLRIYELINN